MAGVVLSVALGHPTQILAEGRPSNLAGTVTGDVRMTEGLASFPFALEGGRTVRATFRGEVRAGERLRVRGRLTPIDEARNPGEPSPRSIAIDDGIAGELHVERLITRAPPDLRDIRIWMPLLRERAACVVRASLPEPQATVLAGALWGERGTLPRDVRADFQTTGTVHVLVTAGLHIGVVAALVGGILVCLSLPRFVCALGTIPPIFLYAWFSGWHLPSQRAAVMLAVALIARAYGARSVSLNTLALSAIVIAGMWPVAVTSASFALSFSCVGAIVLFAERIAEYLRERRVHPRIAEAIALTAATQIGVWPLSAAIFSSIAPFAIAANAIVVPLIGLTVGAGLAALATHGIQPLSVVFLRWDSWLLSIVIGTVRAIASWPGARITIPPPPTWSIIVYDGLAIAALIVSRRSRALAIALPIAGTLLVLLSAFPRPSGDLQIVMLDVGQGDAIVIRTPRGHTIMIDTGGMLERGATIDGQSPAERAADRIVLPYLQRAGISRIDLLILTHQHGDHVGGFAGIVRTLHVDQIFDSGQVYGGRAFNDGMHEAALHHVPVHIARCGDHWSSDDGVQIDVFSPCGALLEDGKNDVNENSIVAMLHSGSFRMLFTGDAGFETERRLLTRGIDLHADVLKTGHHGSAYATSPEFIAAVQPRLALISVGRHNLFGHPARSTIANIEATNAQVYRTDTCGAVMLTIADDLHLATMLGCNFATRSLRNR